MKAGWKVSRNCVCGEDLYIAYRLRDINRVDHSGNREYGCDYTPNRDEAQAVADKLNEEEAK